MKLFDEWNKQPFTIYTSEERGVLGLLKRLGVWVGKVIQQLDILDQLTNENKNKKVSYDDMKNMYNFHKGENGKQDYQGSWFGIPRPEYAEPGIQGQVTANREEIEEARLGETSLFKIIKKIYDKIFNSIYYVSLDDYGVKGDGITDDTENIQRCIDENPNRIIKSKSGKTYKITKGLKITDYIKIDFSNSYIDAQPLECCEIDNIFIASNKENAEKVATIKNVTIKGNHKAKKGIYVTAFRILELKNVNIENCLESCLHVERDSVTGRGSLIIDRMILTCTNDEKLPLLQQAKALILDSTDCKISNVISNNFVEHIIANKGVNFIKSWHAWNLNSSFADIINNSKFIVLNNSIYLDMCYSDTLQHGLYLNKNADWINIIVDNFHYYINPSQYPSDKNKPLPIFNEGMLKPQVTITNSVFNNEWNDYEQIDLCNDTINISISQSQIKGFKHQINVGKVKYRSFEIGANEYLSIDKRVLYIKDSLIYLSMSGGLKKQIESGTDITIDITEATIKSRYGNYLENAIPVNCTIKNGNKIYNVSGFYDTYKVYLTVNDTIPSGKITLNAISNYNYLEGKV